MPSKSDYFEAYIEWIMQQVTAGYEPYLLTFMFHQMTGTEAQTTARMEHAITEFYKKILTRIVKHPGAANVYGDFPWLIAATDWPVHSKLKMTIEESTINGGKHWHGIFLLPPRSRYPMRVDKHIEEKQGKFAGPSKPIMRIHAALIETTERKAIGYTLKQVERRRIGHGDLLILPKVHSEMPGR